MSQNLNWGAIAPGLLYEAFGEGGRRYIIVGIGKDWTLEVAVHREFETDHPVDPQTMPTLEAAQRAAQQWESEAW